MANSNLVIGQPIRSLQTFLREISHAKGTIPMVIPDGIYGEQTYQAVKAFQEQSGLEPTGETNRETWDKLRSEYQNIINENSEPEKVVIYPGANHTFRENDSSVYLIPIQALLYVLSSVNPELGTLKITGICEGSTCSMVRKLQRIFGHEENGIIDKKFWNMLSGVYENLVSSNNFYENTSK